MVKQNRSEKEVLTLQNTGFNSSISCSRNRACQMYYTTEKSIIKIKVFYS